MISSVVTSVWLNVVLLKYLQKLDIDVPEEDVKINVTSKEMVAMSGLKINGQAVQKWCSNALYIEAQGQNTFGNVLTVTLSLPINSQSNIHMYEAKMNSQCFKRTLRCSAVWLEGPPSNKEGKMYSTVYRTVSCAETTFHAKWSRFTGLFSCVLGHI